MLDHAHFNFQAVPLGEVLWKRLHDYHRILIRSRCATASRNCMAKRSVGQNYGAQLFWPSNKPFGPSTWIE
jgi:hypothetical protein